MGLSTPSVVFLITGCVGALALVLGLVYAYLYFTKMKPQQEKQDSSRPLPQRPSKMAVVGGRYPIKVPLTEGEIQLQQQNPDVFKEHHERRTALYPNSGEMSRVDLL